MRRQFVLLVFRSCNKRRIQFFSTGMINFNDTRNSYSSKSTSELVRSYLVYSICQTPIIVKYSEQLLQFSYRLLGYMTTNFIMKNSFFSHFCAGEDETSIRPKIKHLNSKGIGAILDYASESDVKNHEKDNELNSVSKQTRNPSLKEASKLVKCRVYDYRDEMLCDSHEKIFESCIRAVHDVSPTGFAAIKCTALGNPKLLEAVSTTITEFKQLFYKFKPDQHGIISKEQFLKSYDIYFNDGESESTFKRLDKDSDGSIDLIEWIDGWSIDELHNLTALCRNVGPLFESTLNEDERELYRAMKKRIFNLAALAKSLNVRLMIDAEHTYFQPAIDNITRELTQKFNTDYPVIFCTYQMYLKGSRERLRTDMKRAELRNYHFAVKLVRGAYMHLERTRALTLGYEDPIWPTIELTHKNYNECVKELIQQMSKNNKLELMIASHNQESVELALNYMKEYNIPPSAHVYFGQLLGMSDHISFSLGKAGYKVYKYVPYGKVHEVMPYLIRRAQENSDALSGAKKELTMIRSELLRRIYLTS